MGSRTTILSDESQVGTPSSIPCRMGMIPLVTTVGVDELFLHAIYCYAGVDESCPLWLIPLFGDLFFIFFIYCEGEGLKRL